VSSLFSATELSAALGGTMTRPFAASGVSIDTRTLRPGDLFVALHTETGDGHDHVAAALAQGAAGALVHRRLDLPEGAPLAIIGDTLAGLTALGGFARARFTGHVAAITGSVGKTTTKEMLRLVLAASGRTHAAVASYNNHWGVPLTLARMPPDDDFAIIEIGMNHPGEIAPLATLAAPDVALVTNVEPAHIGHMGSLEAIADEKASIAQGVRQGGTLVLPADSPMLTRLRRVAGATRTVTFGQANLLRVDEDAEGSDIIAEIDGVRLAFRVGAPGRHMAMNAIAALSVAAALHADLAAGAAALAGFTPIGGRGTRRPILNGRATLLDESYNASAASIRAALAVLKLTPATRRVAVLGDMLELGDFSEQEHRQLADTLRRSADILYCCGPWMKFLYHDLPPSHRGAHAACAEALAPIVKTELRDGDAVLVKGSLGSNMRLIVAALIAAEGCG
jgi:UDP-N-acetylmuramoyl-tripeptide--D-alanyl-D-alanine ligase